VACKWRKRVLEPCWTTGPSGESPSRWQRVSRDYLSIVLFIVRNRTRIRDIHTKKSKSRWSRIFAPVISLLSWNLDLSQFNPVHTQKGTLCLCTILGVAVKIYAVLISKLNGDERDVSRSVCFSRLERSSGIGPVFIWMLNESRVGGGEIHGFPLRMGIRTGRSCCLYRTTAFLEVTLSKLCRHILH
jgi:hypothetical protein